MGSAKPIALVDGLIDTFPVTNGEVLTTLRFQDLIDFHKNERAKATIAVHQREVKIDLGVVQWYGRPQITGYYIEKPTYENCVSMGVNVFEPDVLVFIPHGHYLDFPDLILKLIAAKEKVVGYKFYDYQQDLGRPDDYQIATQDFEKMHDPFLPEA